MTTFIRETWPLLIAGAVMLAMTLFITDCALGGIALCEVREVSQ